MLWFACAVVSNWLVLAIVHDLVDWWDQNGCSLKAHLQATNGRSSVLPLRPTTMGLHRGRLVRVRIVLHTLPSAHLPPAKIPHLPPTAVHPGPVEHTAQFGHFVHAAAIKL